VENEKVSVRIPSVEGTYVYNGSKQTVSLKNFDTSIMTATDNVAINAGITEVKVSLDDKTLYQWEDGTTEEKILSWTILPKDIEVNWGTKTSFVYDEDWHAPIVSAASGIEGESLVVRRTTERDVGTYT
jgi:hypothetical protein